MASSLDIAEPNLTIDDINTGYTLQGNNAEYTVLEYLGQGGFGRVAKCLNVQTKELVAVKILKDPNAIKEADKEVSMLEALRFLDSDAYNVVKFFGRFEHRGLTCLAFEMLEMNVLNFIQSQEWEPLAPCDIRPIAKQLLVTLDGLKGLGVIHTDLKLDNIMLPKVEEQPFRVKVIDFGEARHSYEIRPGMYVQPCGSRAPEVSLGNKFNESIDVFTLGCNLAFLYLGYYLFPINCDYQMVKRMVEILGYPPDYLLSNGVYTKVYFKEVMDEETWSTTWTLLSLEEYEEIAQTTTEDYNDYGSELKTLDDLVDVYPKWEDEEYEDRKALVDLLKGLLHPDPCLRLSPKEALQHSFITMSHLQNMDSAKYFEQSQQLMQVCPASISNHLAAPGSSNSDDWCEASPSEALSDTHQFDRAEDSSDWDNGIPEEDRLFDSPSIPDIRSTVDEALDEPDKFDDWLSSKSDNWCGPCSSEDLSAANYFDKAQDPDSSEWQYRIPEEDRSVHSPSWYEDKYVFCSTGLDKERSSDIWSLEYQRSDDLAHCVQFDDRLTNAGSDGFPDIEVKTSADTLSQNATNTNECLELLSRNLPTIPERVGCQDKVTTKTSVKNVQPKERFIKFDALTRIWSRMRKAVRPKRGANISDSPKFPSLELQDRNVETIVPETRVGSKPKATSKTSPKNVQPKERFIKCDALTKIWSRMRKAVRPKRGANISDSRKFPSLELLDRNVETIVPETRVGSKAKATSKTSSKNVQPKERFIKYDALTAIWSHPRKRLNRKEGLKQLHQWRFHVALDSAVASPASDSVSLITNDAGTDGASKHQESGRVNLSAF